MESLKLLVEEPFYEYDVLIDEKNTKDARDLYIQGPYLMAEQKNKNGRIYTLKEMAPEVNRYIVEMINEKRSLGELNHPSCQTKTADVLTSEGWKSIVDVKKGEFVYTLNTETSNIELNEVEEKIEESYNGVMYRIKGRNIDTLVTPNHRILIKTRYKGFKYITAEELFNDERKYSHEYIPRRGEWNKESESEGIYLDKRFLQVEKIEDFNDMVYCVKTKNTNYYCMDNGKTHWTGNSVEVDPERSCHIITELKQDGNVFNGKSKILSNPMGQIVRSLLLDGVRLGVSSRALGKLIPGAGDAHHVQGFHLICADVVHDPSVNTGKNGVQAFVNGIFEAKDYILQDDGTIVEAANLAYQQFEKNISKLPRSSDAKEEVLKDAILKIFNSLGKSQKI